MQIRSIFTLLIIFGFGCGIKGKPSPPLDPPWIGSGRVVSPEERRKKTIENKDLKKEATDEELNQTKKKQN